MLRYLLAPTLLLTACGDNPSSEPDLNGYWVTVEDEVECLHLVCLRDNLTYTIATDCILEDGSEAMEVDQGTYSVGDTTLTFKPIEGSCSGELEHQGASNPFTLTYNFVTDDQLALKDNTGGGVFDRVDVDDFKSSSTVTFGCFNEDGIFTPAPIAKYQRE